MHIYQDGAKIAISPSARPVPTAPVFVTVDGGNELALTATEADDLAVRLRRAARAARNERGPVVETLGETVRISAYLQHAGRVSPHMLVYTTGDNFPEVVVLNGTQELFIEQVRILGAMFDEALDAAERMR